MDGFVCSGSIRLACSRCSMGIVLERDGAVSSRGGTSHSNWLLPPHAVERMHRLTTQYQHHSSSLEQLDSQVRRPRLRRSEHLTNMKRT